MFQPLLPMLIVPKSIILLEWKKPCTTWDGDETLQMVGYTTYQLMQDLFRNSTSERVQYQIKTKCFRMRPYAFEEHMVMST